MSVIRQRPVNRRGPAGRLIAIAALAGCTALTGCSVFSGNSGASQPKFKRAGPLITLRIGVYGDPGYAAAGLYAQYERLHPDIKIVQVSTARQDTYWQALQG